MLYENHKNKLLITSILFLLMGIAFMVYPANSMVMLVRLTGVFLLLLGLMILIPSLRDRKDLGVRFWALLVVAIIVIAFGIILLARPAVFVDAFWIIMGIILILDGIKNFMYLSAVPFKLINILLSIVSIICGVLIVTHPFGAGLAYMIVIGAFFAYSGASGIFLNIAGKFKRKAVEEELEVLDEEIEDVDADGKAEKNIDAEVDAADDAKAGAGETAGDTEASAEAAAGAEAVEAGTAETEEAGVPDDVDAKALDSARK